MRIKLRFAKGKFYVCFDFVLVFAVVTKLLFSLIMWLYATLWLLIFWVTLQFLFLWRHGNLKPKRFDFCTEYKPIDHTSISLSLEEIDIEASVAFLSLSVYKYPTSFLIGRRWRGGGGGRGANVHPCHSFVGLLSFHANFHRRANVRRGLHQTVYSIQL